ncbi:hypothetical protein CRYUN_Cryun34aG0095000 [Craigia yunnanensis]
METGLEDLWKNLSLTKDEQNDIVVKQNWVDETIDVRRNCLIGNVVINKKINVEIMKMVLQNIWKISVRLVIKEVRDRMFVFQFEDGAEKDKVLMRQPWSFIKCLIVLKEFDGMSSPNEVDMNWRPFWVQIHGLPLGLMSEKIGIMLGEAIGEVVVIESSKDQLAWGKWMKVKVNINISKLIKRGKMITVE